MVLVKIGHFSQEAIFEKVSIGSDLMPIVITKTTIPDCFGILFFSNGGISERITYFHILLHTSTPEDELYLLSHELYYDNIKQNQEAYKACRDIITRAKEEDGKLYLSDLRTEIDPRYPMYFRTNITRRGQNSELFYSHLYLSRDSFVRMRLFLETLLHHKIVTRNLKSWYFSNEYKNMEFVLINRVKIDAVKQEGTSYTTHYTLYDDGIRFPVNFKVKLNEEIPSKNLISVEEYEEKYSNDFSIIELFLEEDYLYLIYKEYTLDHTFVKTKVLKLSTTLYQRTNFIDPKNIK